MKERGILTFDEADSLFTPRHQQNFPLGDPIAIQKPGIYAAAELYFLLFSDDELVNLLDLPNNGQATKMSVMDYDTDVKPLLAKKIWDKILSPSFQPDQEQACIDYMTDINNLPSQAFFQHLKQQHDSGQVEGRLLAARLAYFKQAVSQNLRDILKTNAHVQYGLSKKTLQTSIAIPYEGNDKPNEGSLFCNVWITVNSTFQYYMQRWDEEPVRTKQLITFLLGKIAKSRKQKQALRELCAKVFESNIELQDINNMAWIQEISARLETKRHQRNTDTIELILLYLKEEVIPNQVKLYKERLSSTAQDLGNLGKVTQGYSGTQAGIHTWPQAIEAITAEGTQGQSISALLKDENAVCHEIDSGTPYDIFKQLIPYGYDGKDGFIDVTPLFKGIPNAQVAKAFLKLAEEEKWDIQAVLAYEINPQGQSQLALFKKSHKDPIFIRGSDHKAILKACEPLTLNQVFKYWPQAQIIGSDLPSRVGTCAFATYGSQVTTDIQLQAVNRKRGLTGGFESIHHVITKETATVIRKRLGLSSDTAIKAKHLLAMAELYKRAEEEQLNYEATIQMIDRCARDHARKLLFKAKTLEEMSSTHFEEMMGTYKEVRNLLICSQANDLFEQFGYFSTQIALRKSLDDKVKEIMSIARANAAKYVTQEFLVTLENELQEIVDQQMTRARMPKSVTLHEKSTNKGEMTVQQRVEVQNKVSEKEESQLAKLECVNDKEWPEKLDVYTTDLFTTDPNRPNFVSLRQQMLKHPDQKVCELANMVDPEIYVTDNFLATFKNQPHTLLSDMQQMIHHALVVEDKSRSRIVILSLEDEAFFTQKLKTLPQQTNSERKLWLITPHGIRIEGDATWKNPFLIESSALTEEILKKRVLLIQILVMKGDIANLDSPSIFPAFVNWLDSDPSSKQFKIALLVKALEHLEHSKREFYANERLQDVIQLRFSKEDAILFEEDYVDDTPNPSPEQNNYEQKEDPFANEKIPEKEPEPSTQGTTKRPSRNNQNANRTSNSNNAGNTGNTGNTGSTGNTMPPRLTWFKRITNFFWRIIHAACALIETAVLWIVRIIKVIINVLLTPLFKIIDLIRRILGIHTKAYYSKINSFHQFPRIHVYSYL